MYVRLSDISSEDIRNKKNKIVEQIASQFTEFENMTNLIRMLMDSIKDIIYVKDLKLKYLIVNNAFKEHLGLKKEFKVQGKKDVDFFPKHESDRNYRNERIVIETGQASLNREQFIIGSKQKKIGLVSRYPIFEHGRIIGILTKIVDITKEKQMQFIQSIISDAIDRAKIALGIYCKEQKEFIYSSGDGSNIFGNRPELEGNELLNYWLNNIVHQDDRDLQKKYLEDLDNIPHKRTYRIIHPKRGERVIEAIATKTKFLKRNYVISISHDITKEK